MHNEPTLASADAANQWLVLQTAPIIQPAHIVDVTRDLPPELKVSGVKVVQPGVQEPKRVSKGVSAPRLLSQHQTWRLATGSASAHPIQGS